MAVIYRMLSIVPLVPGAAGAESSRQEVVGMYSTLMLSELAEATYAVRLADAERQRQRRLLLVDHAHRIRRTFARMRAAWHLPWPGSRRTPTTACPTAR